MSFLDILLAMAEIFPGFVARRGARSVPCIGYIADAMGCVYLGDDGEGLSEIVRQRARKLEEGRSVGETDEDNAPLLLFPEGTTTNGTSLISFRSGAFTPMVPVQPIVITYHWRRMSPSWETIPLPYFLWRLLTQLRHRATVVFLPVMSPTLEELAVETGAQDFRERVRRTMANAAGLPLVDVTARDKWELHAAVREGVVPWRWYQSLERRKRA